MSHALSHTPRVHHLRELSREEQTSTIKEGSTPNEQRSCSPLAGRGRSPTASDCPGSCSTSASSPTRDCSHLASTPPQGCPTIGEQGVLAPGEHPPWGGCPPSASNPPGPARRQRAPHQGPWRAPPLWDRSPPGAQSPGGDSPPAPRSSLSHSPPVASTTTHSSFIH